MEHQHFATLLRKMLELADEYKRNYVLFVPIPVLDEKDFDKLLDLAEARNNLLQLEENMKNNTESEE